MRIDPAATISEAQQGASGVPTAAVRAETQPSEVLRTFDPVSPRDWLELVRDIVAAANSGGGTILIHSVPNRWSVGDERQIEKSLAAEGLVARVREFTGSSFTNVIVQAVDRPNLHAIRIAVGPALLPIGFAKSGSYLQSGEDSKQIDVFAAGSFYFRHGNRSLPGTQSDLRVFFERMLRKVRHQWLHGIRRVIDTPTEALLHAGTPRVDLQPVRIVDDPNAPALQPQDVDRLYPYRLKDVVSDLNRRAGRRALTTYDIQAVRRQHQLDQRPDFVFHIKGAGRRYSPAMIDWLWKRWERESEFFHEARVADQQMLRRRRQMPR